MASENRRGEQGSPEVGAREGDVSHLLSHAPKALTSRGGQPAGCLSSRWSTQTLRKGAHGENCSSDVVRRQRSQVGSAQSRCPRSKEASNGFPRASMGVGDGYGSQQEEEPQRKQTVHYVQSSGFSSQPCRKKI